MSRSSGSLTVVGGIYRERCSFPKYREIYGSGLKAASVLGSIGCRPILKSVATERTRQHAKQLGATYDFSCDVKPSNVELTFSYLHTLSGGVQTPKHFDAVDIEVGSVEAALVFGMVESSVSVSAEYLVYDPQRPEPAESFLPSGLEGDKLAIVLNSEEAKCATGVSSGVIDAAKAVLRGWNASVVVVKDGPRGAFVSDRKGASEYIPVYESEATFLLGSGDVFSAVFAQKWAVDKVDPICAATEASRQTAEWCSNGMHPPVIEESGITVAGKRSTEGSRSPSLYLAGPFFSAHQLWWVEHSRDILTRLGFNVLSPYHDIGIATSNNRSIAEKDVEAIKRSDVVFALLDGLDPGTLIEIGIARSQRIPVVGLRTEGELGLHQTMLEGTGCYISTDFGSAAYKAYWISTKHLK